jgi:cysteine desulfurase/selenocysteine lyase
MVAFRETVGGSQMTQAGNTVMETVRPDRSTRFDVEKVRRDFPILREKVQGKPLVYLDNAATSQKPQAVIETLQKYYSLENANIHRGIHFLSERATQAYEDARAKVARFINAADGREIIFVRGTTEGINLVAHSYGRKFIGEEDEIILSAMEHHSNIVPWQILCEQVGARLRIIPMNDDGELLIDEYERLLSDRTKLVAVTHLSNALGTINPVKQIIQIAHRRGVPVLVDGAQAAPHLKVDVRDLDCDFYAFSGHKLYGPTGVGVLYGRASFLDAVPPYQGGGDMIRSVTFEKTLYNILPYKFEAGTPNIAGGIGLGAAIDYLSQVGLELVTAYERELLDYATKAVSTISGVRIIGTARDKAGVLSFVLGGVHAHDVGTILDQEGIAIRTGHHCAMPVMELFGVPATARASLAFYNTRDEVDALVGAIHKAKKVFDR